MHPVVCHTKGACREHPDCSAQLLVPSFSAMAMTLCTPFEGHVFYFSFVLWPLLVLNITVLLWGAIMCNLNTTNFIIMLAATTG